MKSAVIFAGLNSYGITNINEKLSSRDHTENLLIKNNKSIKIRKGKKKNSNFGKNDIKPINISVGGDPSSAAFYTTLTLLNKNSFIKIKNVGLNPSRIGFYKILKNKRQNKIYKFKKRK